MSHHISSVSSPARPNALATAPAPDQDGGVATSLAGIGDIVMAGERSGYAHLTTRAVPTVGQLAAAARGAAEFLVRPTLWPRRRGHWQLVPRAARRRARGRMRVTVVALEPNEFVSTVTVRPGAPAAEVLHLVSGRAHTVATGAAGQLLAVQELTGGRARVLGGGAYQLINTGTETAVVVRVGA